MRKRVSKTRVCADVAGRDRAGRHIGRRSAAEHVISEEGAGRIRGSFHASPITGGLVAVCAFVVAVSAALLARTGRQVLEIGDESDGNNLSSAGKRRRLLRWPERAPPARTLHRCG
jgi:hypothetical protein